MLLKARMYPLDTAFPNTASRVKSPYTLTNSDLNPSNVFVVSIYETVVTPSAGPLSIV